MFSNWLNIFTCLFSPLPEPVYMWACGEWCFRVSIPTCWGEGVIWGGDVSVQGWLVVPPPVGCSNYRVVCAVYLIFHLHNVVMIINSHKKFPPVLLIILEINQEKHTVTTEWLQPFQFNYQHLSLILFSKLENFDFTYLFVNFIWTCSYVYLSSIYYNFDINWLFTIIM